MFVYIFFTITSWSCPTLPRVGYSDFLLRLFSHSLMSGCICQFFCNGKIINKEAQTFCFYFHFFIITSWFSSSLSNYRCCQRVSVDSIWLGGFPPAQLRLLFWLFAHALLAGCICRLRCNSKITNKKAQTFVCLHFFYNYLIKLANSSKSAIFCWFSASALCTFVNVCVYASVSLQW